MAKRASLESVLAHDPDLGRVHSRNPLDRVPLFFADQPYVYAATSVSAFANSTSAASACGAFGPGGVCTGTGADVFLICASSCATCAFATASCCSSAQMPGASNSTAVR